MRSVDVGRILGTDVALFLGKRAVLSRVSGQPFAGETFSRPDAVAFTASYVGAAGLIVYADANQLRERHYIGGVPTILVEESRQNICLQSEDLSTTWVTTASTVSANSARAPDGQPTADKIQETATSAVHGVNQVVTTANQPYVLSAFLQPVERQWGEINESLNVTAKVSFDLINQVIGTVSGTGSPRAFLEKYSPLWSRCAMAFLEAGNQFRVRVNVSTTTNNDSYLGIAGDGIYQWGAQAEKGTFPTSYIKTVGSAVTRAADAWTIPGVAVAAPATLFYRYYDLATQTWINSVQPYASPARITPPLNRAYQMIAVLRGVPSSYQAASSMRLV